MPEARSASGDPDAALFDAVVAGDRRALARALTQVEAAPGGPLAGRFYRHGGHAHVVGITGSPGSGKSTLVAAMAQAYRAAGRSVGVVAVDASSPYTGGAVLGDRVRMGALAGDPGVFIRSLASRGQVGGLALAAGAVVRALDAAGCDVILVETVGAGQTEVEIAGEAHTTIVVLVPGLGDGIQAIKAGIMEIADVYAVNKADLPGAEAVAASVSALLGMSHPPAPVGWRPPILRTAARTGEGVDALVAAADAHAGWLRESGQWAVRERQRARAELERLVLAQVAEWVHGLGELDAAASDGAAHDPGPAGPTGLFDRLMARETDPGTAAETLLAGLITQAKGTRGR